MLSEEIVQNNKESFEKSKIELITKYNENVDRINLYHERQRLLEDDNFENKTIGSIVLGFITYLFSSLMFLSSGLEKISSVIPADLLPILLLALFPVTSLLFKNIYEKTHGLKEIKTFSKSKTYSEKLEECLGYQIEREKLINRNEAIEEALNTLEANERYFSSFSQKYNIEKVGESTSIPNINQEKKLLDESYKELDILTTKKILTTKFWSTRYKPNKYFYSIVYGLLVGTIGFFGLTLPFQFLEEYITYMNLISKLMFISPIIGIITSSIFVMQRYKNNMKVFNKLNNKLGKDAINDKVKEYKKDSQKYDSQIINAINKVSKAEIILQEQKREIELFHLKDTPDNKDYSKNFEEENVDEISLFNNNLIEEKISKPKKRILIN